MIVERAVATAFTERLANSSAFPEISRKVDERLRLQLETDGCSDIRIEPDTRYFREPFTDEEGNYYEGEWMLQRVAIGVATLGG